MIRIWYNTIRKEFAMKENKRFYLFGILGFCAVNLFSFLIFFIPNYVIEADIGWFEYVRLFLNKFAEFALPPIAAALLIKVYFNGGIKRSVKTLSGGERFIVSLSLALGISQSIAVNNDKNFNFFFIDEGFGNLSENYIEKVLQSFDALINLNFTVGFITHVEKMQYYLNSKIIVTKDNTDEGSKIEEYY